jgi:hypothetical protein
MMMMMAMMIKAYNSAYPINSAPRSSDKSRDGSVVVAVSTVTMAETVTALKICHKSRYTIWSSSCIGHLQYIEELNCSNFRLTVKNYAMMMMMNRCSEACTP